VINQNKAFVNSYTGTGNSGCYENAIKISAFGDNQIKFLLENGPYVYASVNSLTNASIISMSDYSFETDGSSLSITGGTITLNGNSLTMTILFSSYDADEDESYNASCTSVFSK